MNNNDNLFAAIFAETFTNLLTNSLPNNNLTNLFDEKEYNTLENKEIIETHVRSIV